MLFHFAQEFLHDYEVFENQVLDLDRRLGAIICQGFDDCGGLEGIFKVNIMAHSKIKHSFYVAMNLNSSINIWHF